MALDNRHSGIFFFIFFFLFLHEMGVVGTHWTAQPRHILWLLSRKMDTLAGEYMVSAPKGLKPVRGLEILLLWLKFSEDLYL